ncbi:MAG: hypothetical protein IKD71_07400 [Solobacterium sp.]|nr:hypothetical protein [Solobacterium sp.]
MSSDDGFILTDVLIAVVFVALCADIMQSTTRLYSTSNSRLRESIQQNEQAYRAELQSTEECILCTEVNPE